MTCQQARKNIPLFSGKELPESEQNALAEHLQTCPACQALAREYRQLHEHSRDILQPDEPPGFYDQFASEVLQRLPRGKTAPARSKTSPIRHRWNGRPALAWATAAGIAAALFLVLILFRADLQTFFRPRTTLQAYLQQQDFQGLARALTNDRTREALVQDSVSVDLLLQSVQELERLNRRDKAIGRFIGQSLGLAWGVLEQGPRRARAFCLQSPAGEFNFYKAIRGLRLIGQSRKKVTLSEIAAIAERYC